MIETINKVLGQIVGNKATRDLKQLSPFAKEVNKVYDTLQNISDDELRSKTAVFKNKIAEYIKAEEDEVKSLKQQIENDQDLPFDKKDEIYRKIDKLEEKILERIESKLNEIMPEAFAVVKETSKRLKENQSLTVTATDFDRDLAAKKSNVTISGDKATHQNKWMAAGTEITWDMAHYDVQLMGGKVLHDGKIAEMATGEGKTLVSTLAIYLNALAGRGVHLVTVNDYLARRDSEWNGPLFEFHQLSVDCIDKYQPNSEERRKAYLADITYGTNNEFGFDYLRDNMATQPEELVQRKHHYAIIDEVDSVLIDDARTPLIISGPIPEGDKHEFYELKPLIEKLVAAQKQFVNTALADAKHKLSQIDIEDKKLAKQNQEEGSLALLRCFRGLPKNKALIKFLSESGMKAMMQKTQNFYMQDNSREMYKVDTELYFVIDEQNNTIELSEKGIDFVSTDDDPNFLIIPDIGSEVEAIENSEDSPEKKMKRKDKLMQDYSVKAERIHTTNQLLKAYTLFEKDDEYVVMDGMVKIVDEQTGRIMEGRRYSDGLHQAIEAKENVKVEDATQTYATITLQNYFRMYHKLAGMTGTAETEAGEFWDIYKLDVTAIPTNKPIIRKDENDLVYKTKREKYKFVIEEIENLVKAGRPVLVGTTSVDISEQLSRMLKMKHIDHNVLNAKMHKKEAEIVANAGKAGTVTIATNMAGRGTDIKLGAGVKEAGGLAIIGTERHESRRVDRQLRGRAGRQGDPGSSQFFVSLEDDLMRVFGSERIAKLMDRMGLDEGEVIQHSMISRSIERAQMKVEENNFGIRKHLLEYDDVMNSQRTAIYDRRKHALFGDRLDIDISNMLLDAVENTVEMHKEGNDYESFKLDLIRTFALEPPVNDIEFLEIKNTELSNQLTVQLQQNFRNKRDVIAQTTFPVMQQILQNEGERFEMVNIPFTDGIKTLAVICNIRKAVDTKGLEVYKAFQKGIVLAMIDNLWKEHLRQMDSLKESVQSVQYAQKDPLLIYKLEAFDLFSAFVDKVNREVISFLIKAGLADENGRIQEAPMQRKQQRLETSRSGGMPMPGQPYDEEAPEKTQPVRVEKKIGRNEPCPCGSGKKYKHCHGRGM